MKTRQSNLIFSILLAIGLFTGLTFTAHPAAAASSAATLIDTLNTGGYSGIWVDVTSIAHQAQSFKTNSNGLVTSITLNLFRSSPSGTYKVEIWSATAAHQPNTMFVSVTSNGNIGALDATGSGIVTFSGLKINLTPNTEYFVMVYTSGAAIIRWGYNDCVSGLCSGTTPSYNTYYVVTEGSGWSNPDSSAPFRMKIDAEPPTATLVDNLSVRAAANGVKLGWKAILPEQVNGFNVYRSQAGGEKVKLNSELITIGLDGAGEYVDSTAQPWQKYDYQLETVAASSEQVEMGPGGWFPVYLPLLSK
jgi:hypothetical protein